MRTLKPNCLSVLPRCVEHQRTNYLCLSVFGMVPMREPAMLFSDQNLWKLLPVAAPEFVEAGMPKTRSEFLVMGAAYPPPEQDVLSVAFGIRFAGIDKVARAHGRRVAKHSELVASDPLRRAALEWSNAYGGAAYPRNPRGTGHPSSADGEGQILLPQIESVDHPWHPDPERNQPMVFGVIDPSHPDRMAGAGTYDDEWLKNDYPGLARDADWTIFNVAPADQRRVDPFAGDETFDLVHLCDGQARIQGRLPGVQATAFVQRKSALNALHSMTLALRTVVFMPDFDRAVLIWQGLCRIDSDDGSDVASIMVGAERIGEPKPIEHYGAVLRGRTESEDAMLISLQDDQLLPPDLPFESLIPADLDLNRPPPPDSYQARLRRRLERQMQSARDTVQKHGLDAAGHAPPEAFPAAPKIPPLPQLGEFMRQLTEEGKRRTEEGRSQTAGMIKEVERKFQELGQDFEPIRREMRGDDVPRGPPQPTMPAKLDTLSTLNAMAQAQQFRIAEVEGMLADAALHARWQKDDQDRLASYRANAHLMSAVRPSRGRFAGRQQRWVEERLSSGQGLGGLDLTGADLRRFDLRGVDCSGAMLEGANLSGMNLEGTNFHSAVLAHAILTGARVQGCDFGSANLGKASLEEIDATGATFADANLWEANLSRALMRAARFAEAQFYGAKLAGADFSEAALENAQFLHTELRGANFDSARIDEAQFVSCILEEASWRNCSGANVVFFNLRCPGGDFSGASLPRARLVGAIELEGACFERANLSRAYFAQGAVLGKANFDSVQASFADFTGCEAGGALFRHADLRGASLRKAGLQGADLSGANLMDANLMNARLFGARLVSCNLFAADLARVHFDSDTHFDGSLTKRARTYPRWQAGGTAS